MTGNSFDEVVRLAGPDPALAWLTEKVSRLARNLDRGDECRGRNAVEIDDGPQQAARKEIGAEEGRDGSA